MAKPGMGGYFVQYNLWPKTQKIISRKGINIDYET